eukprot:2519220-Prorocentrum_lima.AAC.1
MVIPAHSGKESWRMLWRSVAQQSVVGQSCEASFKTRCAAAFPEISSTCSVGKGSQAQHSSR